MLSVKQVLVWKKGFMILFDFIKKTFLSKPYVVCWLLIKMLSGDKQYL
jgi:hypothetical protein